MPEPSRNSDYSPLIQVDADSGKPKLSLHPGQRRAWNSYARFIAIIAGHQAGKTVFGPHWLAREIGLKGTGDYLAVTATYDLFKLKMLPALLSLFTPASGWNYAVGDQVLTHTPSLTRIILRSATSPGGLEAGTCRRAWLDECGQDAFVREAWEAIQRRLAIHRGRVLMTTTPYNFGWLKTEVYDRAKAGDPDYEVIQFPSIENPTYPRLEYERQKATLPFWKFEMSCNGNFTLPAGLIYSDYSETYAPQTQYGTVNLLKYNPDVHGHLLRPFTPPVSFPRLVGIDFGGTEHTALIWLAEDPNLSIYYAYREAIGGGLSGPEHARYALQYTKVNPTTQQPNELVRVWAGGARSEGDARLEWNMVGVPVVEPLITGVEAGIDKVVALFKERRLFIMETLVQLRRELLTYSRELDDAGNPTMKIDTKTKSKYHMLDALRGIASHIPIKAPTLSAEEIEARIALAQMQQANPRSAFLDQLDDYEDGRSPVNPVGAVEDVAHFVPEDRNFRLPRWRGRHRWRRP